MLSTTVPRMGTATSTPSFRAMSPYDELAVSAIVFFTPRDLR